MVEEEAFRLKAGEQSGIIGVGDKFVIMRCLGRTKPVVADFAAAKDELTKDIGEKKLRLAMAAEFDRLKESAQIDNFLASTSQPGQRLADRGGSAAPAAARQPVAPNAAAGPGVPQRTATAPARTTAPPRTGAPLRSAPVPAAGTLKR